ncbi:MAG: glutaminyl-peptide cyclotransferase [Gemmatimonadota bacterium]
MEYTPSRFVALLSAWLAALGLTLLSACHGESAPNADSSPTGNSDSVGVPTYTYRVANIYPHDPEAFTQGLVYAGGRLYEGTGLYGQSSLREVELETGRVLRERRLEAAYFGEGIALVSDRVFQLTYRSRRGFVYRLDDFATLADFGYTTEGWGLAWDGQRLIMSDGSASLSFRDPGSFAETGRVEVRYSGGDLRNLNELECIGGEVWANIWQTDLIARIAPQTGQVVAWVDLAGLLTASERSRADVLNGIAADAATGRIFVTGKLWPWLFEIEPVLPRAGRGKG